MLTKKQTTTLVFFAQNYSLPIIAKKQRVSLSTIRERIRSLSKHYPIEFGNALDLRNVYKRNRDGIRNAARNSNCFRLDFEWETRVGTIEDLPKRTFDRNYIEIKDKF